VIAVLLFAAGVALMIGSAGAAARLELGLRGQVALGTLLFAVPAAAALARSARARAACLGDLNPGRRPLVLSVLLGAALWVASIGLVELQSLVRPPRPEELELFRRLHAALAPRGALDAVASLLVIAILPAICEELVMRGALLMSLVPVATSLAGAAGPALSVALTAAAFGLIHDPVRLLFAVALGVALGVLRLRTRSLLPPVVAHATLNALTFVVAPLVDDPTQPYEPRPALGVGCLVLGLALAWPLLRALRPRPAAVAPAA
jgi:membrane protease YdiL (CAAX protease family)